MKSRLDSFATPTVKTYAQVARPLAYLGRKLSNDISVTGSGGRQDSQHAVDNLRRVHLTAEVAIRRPWMGGAPFLTGGSGGAHDLAPTVLIPPYGGCQGRPPAKRRHRRDVQRAGHVQWTRARNNVGGELCDDRGELAQ